MKPIVSIIIRTFNEDDWIWHCLKAIEDQSFKNFEVIIVDNFSSDSTVKISKSFKFVKKILKIKKFVPGKAINYGCSYSKGDYLVFLSAHCIPSDNDWLKNLLSNFKNKKVAAVYGKQSPVKYSQAENIRDLYITFGNERRIQKKDNFFHNANSVIRKSIWKKIPFSNTLSNIEDRDWSKKIIKKNFWIVYEPKSNVYHYHGIHHGTNTQRLNSTIKVIEQIETKNYLKLPDTLKPENIKLLILVNFSNYKNNNFNNKILNDLIDDIQKLNFKKKIFLVKPPNFSKKNLDKEIQLYNYKKKQNLTEILKFATLKNINNSYFPDYVLYLNADYIFRPFKMVNELVNYMCDNGYDSLIPVFRHFNTNFVKKNKNSEFDIFGKNLENRSKKIPSYLSYYGFGTLVKSKIARKGILISEKNNGLFQLKSKLDTIRLSEINPKIIKKKFKNNDV